MGFSIGGFSLGNLGDAIGQVFNNDELSETLGKIGDVADVVTGYSNQASTFATSNPIAALLASANSNASALGSNYLGALSGGLTRAQIDQLASDTSLQGLSSSQQRAVIDMMAASNVRAGLSGGSEDKLGNVNGVNSQQANDLKAWMKQKGFTDSEIAKATDPNDPGASMTMRLQMIGDASKFQAQLAEAMSNLKARESKAEDTIVGNLRG